VYEVPYDMAEDWPQRWREYAEALDVALAEGRRRGDAFELFMRVADSSEDAIAGARNSPMWPELEAIAHTLAYDAACMGTGQPPADRFTKIRQPTLVATGVAGRQPGAARWVRALEPAADAIAASIPHAQRQTIEGAGHVADPKAVAVVLERFFKA